MSPDNANGAVIDLEAPDSWPSDVLAHLHTHHRLFLDWDEFGSKNVTARAYDRAIYDLDDILQQYEVIGWHCTRLTDEEMAVINSSGLQIPDAAMLNRRIEAILKAGYITEIVATRLKSKNQANEESRAGQIWFYLFPPRVDGELGTDCLRLWGGEALYNSHDRDPLTGAVLRAIGAPCLIEADVPIASFGPLSGAPFNLVRSFLISGGRQTKRPAHLAERITDPLAEKNIRRIIRYPDPDFLKLTGCDKWYEPLT